MAAAPNAGSSHNHCHHLATRIPELKEFIDHQLATKGYGNVSEYFRSPLREAQKEEEDARPETLLKAWRSGPIFRLRRNSGGTSRPKRGSSPRSTRRGSGRERYYSPKGARRYPGQFCWYLGRTVRARRRVPVPESRRGVDRAVIEYFLSNDV
jgi:Arc/MetJ-type ribon-helix-helix transcriptional regulator